MTFASFFRSRCQRSIKRKARSGKRSMVASSIVEFDRVVKLGPSLPMHDVSEMQVAMTAADRTFSLALFDQGEFGAQLLAKMLDIRGDFQPPCLSERAAQRIFDILRQLLKKMRKTGSVAYRSVTMEMLDSIGQLFHQFAGQAPSQAILSSRAAWSIRRITSSRSTASPAPPSSRPCPPGLRVTGRTDK